MSSRETSASEGEIVEAPLKANTSSRPHGPTIANSDTGLGLDGTSDSNSYYDRNRSRSPSPYRHKPNKLPSTQYRNGRNRSPSPYRHGRGRRPNGKNNKRKASPHRDRGKYQNRRHQSVSDKKHNSVHSFDNEHDESASRFGDNAPRQRHLIGHQVQDSTDVEMTLGAVEEKIEMTLEAVEEMIPTQESREEKKRRWAAKRAQHAAESTTSLLQQTLLTNASENATPNLASPACVPDESVSPQSGSPRFPDMESMPASPDVMVVDKQEEPAAGASPPEGGPSASNYDPTRDMLDDRVRAERKTQQSGMSAAAYDETNPMILSTLPDEKARQAKKKKKELDMFAFSDEEDEGEEEEEEEEAESGQNGVVKGIVLDESLLDNWDDPEGYYKIISKELVNGCRYRVVKIIGRGVYSNVAQAEDVKEGPGKLVAIKIVRKNDLMRKASQKEMAFVRRLNEADPQDKRHVVQLLRAFDHKGHLCIVFEHMSKNLRDLLKEETSGHGLSLQALKIYASQMFSGLKHLQDHHIIHADIKPDNILVSLDQKTIKLCDFGTAVDKRDNNDPTTYLVSRFYRAPEIILGMDIGYAIDMWAMGCTIYELWTGKILFSGSSNNQMIKVMMECLGWPSEKLLKKGLLSGQHFEAGPPLTLVSREMDKLSKPVVRKVVQQRTANNPLKTRVHEAARGITANKPSTTDLNDFVDLLTACLNWNFEKRIHPKEATSHRFFTKPSLAPQSAVVKPFMQKHKYSGQK